MQIHPTDIPDVLLIEPKVFGDARGFFMETYHARKFREAGITANFVQDNLSRSARNVVRGLHFQIRQPQAKLVQVLAGEVFDVAVDLRQSSKTFGHWVGVRLSAENRQALYIPHGFAHGFCVISETADVFYKCDDFYAPEHERTLRWDDATVNITWPLAGPPGLSAKDSNAPALSAVERFDAGER